MEAQTGRRGCDIVLTDVDGTLLASDHRPCSEGVSVIRRLVSEGVPFALVSGRGPTGLYPVQADLGIEGPIVAFSGALALDEHREVLLSRTFDLATAVELKRRINDELPELCCMGYAFDTWASDDRSDPRVAREERIVRAESVAAPYEEVFAETGCLHKLLLVGRQGMMAEVRDRVTAMAPELTVVLSSPILCEVMAKGVSKAEGVRALCGHYGVDVSRAVAFGDSYNDVDMLRAVPRSYAMAGAPEAVRDVAAFVTERTNDDNGLACELQRLMGW